MILFLLISYVAGMLTWGVAWFMTWDLDREFNSDPQRSARNLLLTPVWILPATSELIKLITTVKEDAR